MNRFRFYFQRLLIILRIHAVAGGLDVSDEAIRLAYLKGKSWQFLEVRLEPGLLQNGAIQNRDAFIAACVSLRDASKKAFGGLGKKMNVVLSLSSAPVYNQVFSLPNLSGRELSKAAELNLKMVSPLDIDKMHAGWRVVSKREGSRSVEVLASFIEKEVVDSMVQALFEGGFFAIAVEPRSLAITRIVRDRSSGFDIQKPYLLIRLDNGGMEFLVIRDGELYFEYGSRWIDIAEPDGEIALPRLQSELVAHMRQVLSFYEKHWSDPIAAIFLATNTLEEEIQSAIAPNINVPVVSIAIDIGQPVSSDWLVALGSALWGLSEEGGRSEINLLGDEWKEQLHQQQALEFLGFWQILMPIALVLIVGVFVAFMIFLGSVNMSLASNGKQDGFPSAENAELKSLIASSTAFNDEVASIQQIEGGPQPALPMFNLVLGLASSTGVTIGNASFVENTQTATISGFAESEDVITSFKDALSATHGVSGVNLPLSNIQENSGGYSFSVTFFYNS